MFSTARLVGVSVIHGVLKYSVKVTAMSPWNR